MSEIVHTKIHLKLQPLTWRVILFLHFSVIEYINFRIDMAAKG